MRTLMVALLLTACTKPVDSDPVDTDPVDTGLDTSPCRLDREAFEAQTRDRLCEYALSCPDAVVTSMQECREILRNSWNTTVCWDDCLATTCAEWLNTNPVCPDSIGTTDPSCVEMANCQD